MVLFKITQFVVLLMFCAVFISDTIEINKRGK